MAVNQVALAATLVNAVNALQDAIAGAGTLAGATLQQLAPVSAAASVAVPVFAAAVAALDADITTQSLAGVVVGTPVPVIVTTLWAQMSEVNQLAVVLNSQAYLNRLAANIKNATG